MNANPEKEKKEICYIYSNLGVTGVTGVTKNEEPQQEPVRAVSNLLHPNLFRGVTGVTDLPAEAREQLEGLLKKFSDADVPLTVKEINYIGFPDEVAALVMELLERHSILNIIKLTELLAERGKGYYQLKDGFNGFVIMPGVSCELKQAIKKLLKENKIEIYRCNHSVYAGYREKTRAYRKINWVPVVIAKAGIVQAIRERRKAK